jgi:protein-S-isoprenylcysteine O-methyltransferase Ste14
MSKRTFLRAAVGFLIYLLFVPALLFISAGTLDWPMAWVYTGLSLASAVGSRLIVLRSNPDLLRERASFTDAEGTQSWDRFLSPFVGLFGPILGVIVAGLDKRFIWSSGVPVGVQVLALLVVALSFGIAVWAMAVNPFFSAVARIQRERGQQVVASGPYRWVRHPAYAASVLASLALPFMLDALLALVPGLLMVAALVIRTRLEDRMLVAGLEGYRAYTRHTPYRLVPGVW